MIDADVLWRQLHVEALVDAEKPAAARPEPWVARLLTGVAAWIATPLLLAFVGLLLGDLLIDGAGGVFVGVPLCAITLPLLRKPASEFMQQAATVANLVGIILVGIGLDSGFGLSDREVASALGMLSAMLFWLSREWVHRFMCAIVLLLSVLWLISGESGHYLGVLQPALGALALVLWWLDARVDSAGDRHAWLSPLAWSATLTAIVLAWFFDAGAGWRPIDPAVLAWSGYAGAALLPLTVLALPGISGFGRDRGLFMLILTATVLLAWLWREAPGITLSLALILIAYARGAIVLLVVAVAALAIYLVAFYYQLAVPLLDKALWLGIAGVALLALHLALRHQREDVR
jgi:hypothetical protein